MSDRNHSNRLSAPLAHLYRVPAVRIDVDKDHPDYPDMPAWRDHKELPKVFRRYSEYVDPECVCSISEYRHSNGPNGTCRVIYLSTPEREFYTLLSVEEIEAVFVDK